MFKRKKLMALEDFEKLKVFGELYMSLTTKIAEILETKTDAEIVDIVKTAKKVKKNNCWFAIYRVKELIISTGGEILKKRLEKEKFIKEATKGM